MAWDWQPAKIKKNRLRRLALISCGIIAQAFTVGKMAIPQMPDFENVHAKDLA